MKRDQILAEQLIREHIHERIKKKLNQKKLVETEIRIAVKRLLEAETGTEEPSQNTGINVLADLLEKIIPTIENDYKMLTTSTEQRESFRNHIVHAIKNSLRPIEAASDAASTTGGLPENYEFLYSPKELLEKLKIDLDPEGDSAGESVEGEFIDIEGTEEVDDFVQIDDQNETGRNFAATSFKKIEKQIVDAYDMLADEEDQNLFYDYLVTNMLLYFDKFEDELAPQLPDTTTPEYEEEKDKGETGEGSESAEEETEEGGDLADIEPAA